MTITFEFPESKANELEGLISALTVLGGKLLPAQGTPKSPVKPVKETKAQVRARINAKLDKKYGGIIRV